MDRTCSTYRRWGGAEKWTGSPAQQGERQPQDGGFDSPPAIIDEALRTAPETAPHQRRERKEAMTFEEKLNEMLTERGMFPDQAAQVVEIIKADKANEAMCGRWNDHIEGYPDVMISVLWIAAKRAALDWIDEYCPKAWYRPMFDRA